MNADQRWRWFQLKMSNNGAETIRRILDNKITYYFIKILVWAGYKIFRDEVDQNAI